MPAIVVTSETLAAKDQAASAPAPAEAVKPTEPVVEQTTDAPPDVAEPQDNQDTPEVKAAKAKRKEELNKRFSVLTGDRDTARREAQEARQRAENAEAKTRELEAKLTPPKEEVKVEAKPLPGQFTDAFEYAAALADWSAEQALARRDKEDAEKKQIAERSKVIDDWNKRRTAVEEKIPDYKETIQSSTVQVSNAVRDALLESDMGHEVLYYLAKNPDVAESLNEKSVLAQLRQVGKLEAQLSEPKTAEPEKPVVTPSRASPPINPLKGTTAIDATKVGTDGEWHGTYEQYKNARKAGKIK